MFLVSGSGGIVDVDISSIISIALWIPFGLVALISGLIFAISGYKKGLWRSLIGFAATILSAVISMFLGNLLGRLFAPAVVAALPLGTLENMQLMGGLAATLVETAFSYVIALVLFSFLFFFITILLRGIGHSIAPGKLLPKTNLSKLGGMAVGMVCALVYTLLLLLPLYGTVATYAPVAEELMAMSVEEGEENPLSAYMDALIKHPVVQMTNSAPIAAVYNTTTQVTIGNNTTISIADLATTAQDAVDLLDQIQAADESQRPQLCYDLIYMLRTKIADQPWLYDVFMEAKAMLMEEFAAQELGQTDALIWEELFALLDLSRDEFNANVNAILDFALYALENDGYNILMDEDFSRLYDSEIVLKAGQLANCTDQAVAVKNLIWAGCAAELFDNDMSQIHAFMSKYYLPKLTDPKQLEQEAYAIMLLFGFNGGECTPAEFVYWHPSLGQSVLSQMIDEYGFAAMFGIDDPDTAARVNGDKKVQQMLMDQVKSMMDAPFAGGSIEESLSLTENLISMIREDGVSYTPITPADMTTALQIVGKSAFESSSRSGGSQIYEFLNAYSQIDPYAYGPMEVLPGVNSFWYLVDAILDKNLPSSLDSLYNEDYEIEWRMSDSFCSDPVIAIMKQLNTTKGTDPLGLGKKLSSSQKQMLRQYLEDRIAPMGSDSYGSSSSSDMLLGIGSESGLDIGYVGEGTITGIVVNPDGSISMPEEMGGGTITVNPDGSISMPGGMGGNGIIIVGPDGGNSYYGSADWFNLIFPIDERLQIIKTFFGL